MATQAHRSNSVPSVFTFNEKFMPQYLFAPGTFFVCICIFRIFRYVFMVQAYVFPQRHYLKVFDAIIKLIFIYVVNNFCRFELSAQVFFHNITMFFKRPRTIVPNTSVASGHCSSSGWRLFNYVWASPLFPPAVMFRAKTLGYLKSYTAWNRADFHLFRIPEVCVYV